ncbi:Oidioi.mRNA.OKI2018_I69.XSR.g13658.t1.cds [Oikopleura dioica]|uniref:Oidioi.mRNA.OKI2018_I69.XSR.g13658.t1.cds n=1 Tax=Oikopleura dioica TaxID=34765 RepID=A0ABN7S981_OIKDI|nr:Oidioi.mRNA.OKI2018_I69.XSR.g13658.t1.cds [Oikopleura dioica]
MIAFGHSSVLRSPKFEQQRANTIRCPCLDQKEAQDYEMRRASNTYDPRVDIRYNSRTTNKVTREQLFNAIDAYKGKDADVKVAVKEIQLILGENPDLIYEVDDDGDNALIHACKRQIHPRYRNFWIRKGPDIEVVNALLHYGADPNARNQEGKTALHYACMFEPRSSKVRDMYETITKINEEEKRLLTRVVRKLIKAGGDLRLHDKDNKLPFDYAKEIHQTRFRNEMVKFLSFQKEEFIRDIDMHVDPTRLNRVIPGLKKKNARKEKKRKEDEINSFLGPPLLKTLMGKPSFILDQPKLKFTGFGVVLEKTGGKMGGFGEACSIPYIHDSTLFDQKSEQKIRIRHLSLIMSRRVWRGTPVTYLSREEDLPDEKGDLKSFERSDKYDHLNAEIMKNSTIRHPNLLLMMALVHDQSSALIKGIVYERVELGTMKHLMKIGQEIEPFEWVPLMTQIADAVQFLHESNIIHQAIIPEAIMIMSSKVAKLGALCFSRPANDKSFNYESTRIPERLHRYIAPEVLRNDLPTRGVDAFSLCAVLFELMTGYAPWASTKNAKDRVSIEIPAEAPPTDLHTTVRIGLSLELRERKTRLIDIIYVLGNIKMMYHRLECESRNTGSYTGSYQTMKRAQNLTDSPNSKASRFSRGSRFSRPSKLSFTRRKSATLADVRPVGSLRYFEEVSSKRQPDYFVDMNANPTLEDLDYTQPFHLQYDTHTVSAPPTSRSKQSSIRMEQYLTEQLQHVSFNKEDISENAPTPERRQNTTPARGNIFADLQKEIDTAQNEPSEGYDLNGLRTQLEDAKRQIEEQEAQIKSMEETQDLYVTAREDLDVTPEWSTSHPFVRHESRPVPCAFDTTPTRKEEAKKAREAKEEAMFKVPEVPQVDANSLKKSASSTSNASSKGSFSAGLINHFERISAIALSKSETSLPTPRIKETEPREAKSSICHNYIDASIEEKIEILAAPSTSATDTAKLILNDTFNKAVPASCLEEAIDDNSFDSEVLLSGSDVSRARSYTASISSIASSPSETLPRAEESTFEPPTDQTLEWQYDDFVAEKLYGLDLNGKKVFGKGEHHVPVTEYIDDVDSEEAVVVNREEIDYMEPKLVEAKSKMRDANEIPRISVQTATPPFPTLRKTSGMDVRQLPKPNLGLSDLQEESLNVTQDLGKVPQTPSRLSFPQKLAKFRNAEASTSSEKCIFTAPRSKGDVTDSDKPTPLSVVTSTPSVDRFGKTAQLEEFDLNDSFEIEGDTALSLKEDQLNDESDSGEASEISFVAKRLSSPLREAEEIKQMISDSQTSLLAAEQKQRAAEGIEGRRAILSRCKQHETFSKSVDYEGFAGLESEEDGNMNETMTISKGGNKY